MVTFVSRLIIIFTSTYRVIAFVYIFANLSLACSAQRYSCPGLRHHSSFTSSWAIPSGNDLRSLTPFRFLMIPTDAFQNLLGCRPRWNQCESVRNAAGYAPLFFLLVHSAINKGRVQSPHVVIIIYCRLLANYSQVTTQSPTNSFYPTSAMLSTSR